MIVNGRSKSMSETTKTTTKRIKDRKKKFRFAHLTVNSSKIFLLLAVQGVHKVLVCFKKIITLIVFAIEIICKMDLTEENRYFYGFIEILFKFPHVLHH